jgi:hypothetical protein
MDGLRLVLFGIGILIIVVNFFIHLSNLSKVISYCFKTNRIEDYWELVFKGYSARAIISSIIGFILALAIYFIIAPIVLIKRIGADKTYKSQLESGYIVEYEDLDLEGKDLHFNSNLQRETGIEIENVDATGKIRIDAIMVIMKLKEHCDVLNKSFIQKAMADVEVTEGQMAKVPLLLTIDGESYPTYFIYADRQREQYEKVRPLLLDAGFKTVLYFTTLRF